MPVKVQPVEGKAFTVTGRVTRTPWTIIPGIVSGAAYASGDAMGAPFEVDMGSTSGLILGVLVSDLDKEQLAFDVVLFEQMIAGVADNAAFDLSDGERFAYAGHISVVAGDYAAFNDNAAAAVRITPQGYVCPTGRMVCQLVTRGVPNYTGASDLAIRLILIPDLV